MREPEPEPACWQRQSEIKILTQDWNIKWFRKTFKSCDVCVCYKRKRRGYSTEISEKFSFSRKCYYEEENKFILYKKAILFI